MLCAHVRAASADAVPVPNGVAFHLASRFLKWVLVASDLKQLQRAAFPSLIASKSAPLYGHPCSFPEGPYAGFSRYKAGA